MTPAPGRWRVGLIGRPVGHSISPVFQQAAFDALGISAHYELWDTSAAELEGRVRSLRRADALGANVTIPHKREAAVLADDRAAEAEITGAANTLVNVGGRLVAQNTDVGGFAGALASELGYSVRGRRAAVLGAGGSARAVVLALARAGADAIVILNRTEDRAQLLADELGSRLKLPLRAGPLHGNAGALLAQCDLVVNCTSVGLAGTALALALPLDPACLPLPATVVDVVANPLVTPLLAAAAARGHATLGGLAMLVHQGALAFELWTGRTAPLTLMMDAARAAMFAGSAAAGTAEEHEP